MMRVDEVSGSWPFFVFGAVVFERGLIFYKMRHSRFRGNDARGRSWQEFWA